jgi:L-threonylcarbamoyladenylate synthase
MDIVQPDTAGIERAVAALRGGEIVAYPTDSVYGLGVDPFNTAALENLFKLKSRDSSNPVLMIIGDMDHLDCMVDTISPAARKCMNAFWPGQLSLLLPVSTELPDLLVGPQKKLCVRYSAHPIAAQLCKAFGGPITSTSANKSFEIPASSPETLDMEGVSVCIDGGVADGTPSTIYDPDTGNVLREGAISRLDIVNSTF